MRIRLRTLFLITTVVAIVAFTFTLGSAEGFFSVFFFACVFGLKGKKDRWIAGLFLIILLAASFVLAWYTMQAELGRPNYGKNACVDLVFTGSDHKQLTGVLGHLNSELSMSIRSDDTQYTVPFFRFGFIKLSFDKNLPKTEDKIRRKLAEEFPDLTVTIEGYSVSDDED